MRVLHVNPILNVSDIAETIGWFAKLGWTVGFEWQDDPEDPNSPVEFASVTCGEHRLAFLAALDLLAVGGESLVVVGSFDQQAAGVRRPGFGDRSLASLLARRVLGGNDPEVGGQAVGVIEALELADLGADPQGRQRADPAQASQPGDRLGEDRLTGELLELCLDAVASR